MSRRSRAALAVVLGVLLVLAFVWLRRDVGPEAGQPVAEGPAGEGAGPSTVRPAGTGRRLVADPAPPGRVHSFRKGARTAVPRLTTATVARPPAFDAGASRHPRRIDRRGDGPRDRRPGQHADSAALRQALRSRIDQALDSAQGCLDAWAQQDDSLDAGVMLAFSLDARGLDHVWIKDREGVPAGPLACLANAVYPIDWSGLTGETLEVTVPVRYEARDAG